MNRLIDGLAAIAGFVLCVLVGLVCLDVAARYGGLFSMPWSLEVAEYLLYAMTFLGAPWVLRHGWHISVDIAVELLPARARHRTEAVANLIGLIVCAVLLYLSVKAGYRSFSEGILVYETLIFPEWLLLSVAPPAFALMIAIFARFLLGRSPPDGSRRSPDGL